MRSVSSGSEARLSTWRIYRGPDENKTNLATNPNYDVILCANCVTTRIRMNNRREIVEQRFYVIPRQSVRNFKRIFKKLLTTLYISLVEFFKSLRR